jgi:rod shape-determining protein MreD
MTGSIVFSSAILIALAIVKTNLLAFVAIGGATPDLVLIVLLYYGHRNGAMPGQVSGFAAGLVEDFLSVSPFGFHALLRTVIGFLTGMTHNRMVLDPILLPVLYVFIGTVLKGLLAAVIGSIFEIEEVFPALFGPVFFIEAAYNAVLAPLVFGLLGMVKPLNHAVRSRTL